ncbi:MAG: hypothetical protein ACR2Q4_02385 [Geminicoccaceae bacterium]
MPLQMAVSAVDGAMFDSDRILADVNFGSAHKLDADPRRVQIGLPPLGETRLAERWISTRPTETGRENEIAFATDGRFLFGHILLDETAEGHLETIGHHAYAKILDCLQAFGGLNLLRIWNYLGTINQEQDGLERYRSFCIGRARALAAKGIADRMLPAACAVGASAPGLMVSFLAAPDSGRQVENPRQLSAFRYPSRYGPKSPSFSRALTYQMTPDQSLLFISGTASIVGHETRHPGSIEDQFAETCRNLEAVQDAAGDQQTLQSIRVYIRHAYQAPAIIAACKRQFGDRVAVIPLLSAICRRDLLLEIEGLALGNGQAATPTHRF